MKTLLLAISPILAVLCGISVSLSLYADSPIDQRGQSLHKSQVIIYNHAIKQLMHNHPNELRAKIIKSPPAPSHKHVLTSEYHDISQDATAQSGSQTQINQPTATTSQSTSSPSLKASTTKQPSQTTTQHTQQSSQQSGDSKKENYKKTAANTKGHSKDKHADSKDTAKHQAKSKASSSKSSKHAATKKAKGKAETGNKHKKSDSKQSKDKKADAKTKGKGDAKHASKQAANNKAYNTDLSKLLSAELKEQVTASNLSFSKGKVVPQFFPLEIKESNGHEMILTEAEWGAYLKAHPTVNSSLISYQNELAQQAAKTTQKKTPATKTAPAKSSSGSSSASTTPSGCPQGSALGQDGKCHVACTVANTVWNGTICAKAQPVKYIDCSEKYGGTAYENNYGNCVLMPNGTGKVCPKNTCFNGTKQMCETYCPLNTDLKTIKTGETNDYNKMIQLEIKSQEDPDDVEVSNGKLMQQFFDVGVESKAKKNVQLTKTQWAAYLKKNPSVKSKIDTIRDKQAAVIVAEDAKQAARQKAAAAAYKAQQAKDAALDKKEAAGNMSKLYSEEETQITDYESLYQGKNPGMIAVSVNDAGGEQQLTLAQWDAYLKANPDIKAGLENYDAVLVNKAKVAAQKATEEDAQQHASNMNTLYTDEENAIRDEISIGDGNMPGFMDVSVRQASGSTLQLTQSEWNAYIKAHPNVESSLKADSASTKKADAHPLLSHFAV